MGGSPEPPKIGKIILKKVNNQGKQGARVCRQVAAWVPDMFRNIYLVKNHRIANNSTTTKAREKISTCLESLEFKKKICMFQLS
jgi:hypothetical protein